MNLPSRDQARLFDPQPGFLENPGTSADSMNPRSLNPQRPTHCTPGINPDSLNPQGHPDFLNRIQVPRDAPRFLNSQDPRFVESPASAGTRFVIRNFWDQFRILQFPGLDEPTFRNHGLIDHRARGSETQRYFALENTFSVLFDATNPRNFRLRRQIPSFSSDPQKFLCCSSKAPGPVDTPPPQGGPRTSDREFLVM